MKLLSLMAFFASTLLPVAHANIYNCHFSVTIGSFDFRETLQLKPNHRAVFVSKTVVDKSYYFEFLLKESTSKTQLEIIQGQALGEVYIPIDGNDFSIDQDINRFELNKFICRDEARCWSIRCER